MNALPRLVVAGVLALVLGGCGGSYTYSSHGRYHRHHHHGPGEAIVAGIVVGAAVAQLASRPSRAPEPPVYTSTVYVYGPPPAPPPRLSRDAASGTDTLPAFAPQAARAALNGVDVSPCRDAGAPSGFGHAKVVWNPDGRISKVTIDAPSTLSAVAAKCVGDRLGTARVDPFRGSLVTMGTTFHVR